MDESKRAEIVISGDGDNPVLEVDGLPVDVPAGRDPMLVGIELVADAATRRGEPIPATVITDEGNWQWRLLVHPDGTTSDDTDDGRRPRRRPSRLAAAAIGMVVLAGGGITALVVTTGSDRVSGVAAGSVEGPPDTSATTPSVSTSPTPSPTPLAPPSALPTATPAPQPAVPPPVAPARIPQPVVAPAPVVVRTSPRQAPRPTTVPEPAAAAAAPSGRLVVISDGAGTCATASGSAVAAGACTDSAAQQWTATSAGELRQGGRCLVARSGVAVVDCASVPASARTWTPTSPTPGLVNPATSLCLGATGSTVVAAQCGTGRSLRIA